MRYFFLIFILLFTYSCDKKSSKYTDCTDDDYENCETDAPFYGGVNVTITINDDNPKVRIILFKGNYEAGDTLHIDTLNNIKKTYLFELNEFYSAAAYYKKGSDWIIAIDGGNLESYTYTMCEYTCYDILELSLDLRLK